MRNGPSFIGATTPRAGHENWAGSIIHSDNILLISIFSGLRALVPVWYVPEITNIAFSGDIRIWGLSVLIHGLFSSEIYSHFYNMLAKQFLNKTYASAILIFLDQNCSCPSSPFLLASSRLWICNFLLLLSLKTALASSSSFVGFKGMLGCSPSDGDSAQSATTISFGTWTSQVQKVVNRKWKGSYRRMFTGLLAKMTCSLPRATGLSLTFSHVCRSGFFKHRWFRSPWYHCLSRMA